MNDIDLNGDWTLTSVEHPHISVPMVIPGDNCSALVKAGAISNPYYGCNEAEVQWVGASNWVLHKSLTLTKMDMNAAQINLHLSRVDTLATLYINHQQVLKCSNMFRRYSLDVKPWLKSGDNRVEFHFLRADREAQKRAERLPFPIPWAIGNNQIPHMNMIRKTQCHSGWDWGICLMVSGIYDPIRLERVGKIRLDQVQTEQIWRQDGSVEVHVTVKHQATAHSHPITVQLGDDIHQIDSAINDESSHTCFVVHAPNRWWPAGYGEPCLYEMSVTLDQQSIKQKIGLRELQLNTEKDDIGSAMTFNINGFPITAKGANWIPLDAMPGNESSQRYRQLLQDAVDANMNMIRVWGGGQYESDIFYQLCDELGLMVWQDMMFACALYPSTPEFIADVEPEIRDQVRRLKHHPSIVLWCGDNEVIGAIGWYDESKHNRSKYTVNYDRLNRKLSEIIQEEDPSRRFWASSPCNGELDYGDAWHDDNRGDMHYWDVWHSGKSFDAYLMVKPRFCSEFGYQSWPSLAEVKNFTPEDDWNVTSPTFEQHQKNGRGNSIMTEMFTRYFRFPSNFENMLYLSQVQQALAIKTACDHWRANSPICRGMLYWQLNDCWPVSSWSSIEYSGRWKQLHYHAKRFFAPQYAPFVETEFGLELRLINDSRDAVSVTGKVRWMDWSGDELGCWPLSRTIQADDNLALWTLDKSVYDAHRTAGFVFVEIESNGVTLQNTWFGCEFKKLPLAVANIDIEIMDSCIHLTTDKPAFFVHLEHDGLGRFSDSSVTLLPEHPTVIKYLGEDIDLLERTLRLYHLVGSYS